MAAPILVTGCAGFIGFHTASRLLRSGREVVGLDNVNDYYSPRLKRDRLAELARLPGFSFRELDLAPCRLRDERGGRITDQRHAFLHLNLLQNDLNFARGAWQIGHRSGASPSTVWPHTTQIWIFPTCTSFPTRALSWAFVYIAAWILSASRA